MGENNTDTTSFTLPLGCRFYPSDEQLLRHYLAGKNGGDPLSGGGGGGVIKEINLYNFDPFNLPETACFRFGRGGRRQHWFCFVARVLKDRRTRRAGAGFWKRIGRVRVLADSGSGKVVMGKRKCFVFYLGECSKTALKTDWFMYEYALPYTAAFVLCRVFVKAPNKNDLSDNFLSSCAEESVATVRRHIGIQCDGVSASASDEKRQDEKTKNLDVAVETVSKLANHVSEPLHDRIKSTGNVGAGATIFEALSAADMLAILEEDFMELDDLLRPLSGIDCI